jgi:hypothetical protein
LSAGTASVPLGGGNATGAAPLSASALLTSPVFASDGAPAGAEVPVLASPSFLASPVLLVSVTAGLGATMLPATDLRRPTKERPSEVMKKAIAQTAVTLPRKVTAPRPPNALVAAPPPKAAPMPASFPG